MHFTMYEFLWKDDMRGNYQEFIDADPGAFILTREVERLLRIERKVLEIPSLLPIGPVVLKTDPIKNSLNGFAIVWKNQYAALLHEEAKKKLDAAVMYRSNVQNRLELNVTNLDQLNSTLRLLEELRDMENKIDKVYLPIENMYARLKEFDLSLPRQEVNEVDQLRDKWQELMLMAESVSTKLLREDRGAFEQELDKQVKTFVVEVIQFRNSFDAQGPAVPGIEPQEAVQRLHMFTQKYHLYDQKRKTLDSVSHLFGIPCKPFPELDRTGEELELLGLLYGLYQKFIRFDQQFRDTLWADVDLEYASREIESFWDGCLALPSKLKDWDAYHGMRGEIQEYMDVLPLLQRLDSKEIRNRHWLQVMQVTGSSFQLEANVFKLMHLLDIGLLKHRDEVRDICHCAAKELELEIKLRLTEEEWTEQVLVFEPYKKYGPIYLDKSNSERLIEQLEDAEALLANMLTSRFIGPMREEAASWAEKLKEVGEVLELWLEVQDLWQFLEAVFSNHSTAKELPQEAKRFQRIDKGWIKMMKRAYDTKNVLQCCYGGEVPKANVLRHILEELEVCFKSLTTYLDGKRRAFPRFYFVSDPILLAMLSKPNELESIKPYLRSIFTAIYDVSLTPVETPEGDKKPSKSRSRQTSISSHVDQSVRRVAKIDKRLTQVQDSEDQNNNTPTTHQTHISVLPSDELEEVFTTWQAVGVASMDGEKIMLQQKVTLENGVEVWLKHLQTSVSQTLQAMLCDVINDVNNGVPLEELPLKYPTQICRFGMLLAWTREAEIGMLELRYDRKAVQNASKKWMTAMLKLPQALTKSAYKQSDAPMLRTRMEHLITYSIYLRDSMDMMATRKLKEASDFDWKRNFRCYIQKNEETGVIKPVLAWMDGQYQYGNEFYGAQPIVALTPGTDRCHLTMAQAIKQHGGVCVGGASGSGKSETVKGFGLMLGHHINVFECTPQMDTVALGKMLTGLAVDGCWGFFDNLHNASADSMSVLLDYSQTILKSLKAKQAYCVLADGQEISLCPSVSIFLAYSSSVARFELPSDVKAMFRQVCLSRPELGVLLKLKCASLGFRAPYVLAARLKIVCDLARDQLPESYQASFGPTALHGVLLCALNQKRALRDDRAEKTGKDETSRSTSQLSGNAQNAPRGVNQPTSTLFGKKSSVTQPLTAAVRIEHALVGKALLDVMAPKMGAEASVIFTQIVKDIFQSLPDPSVRMRSAAARYQQLDLTNALTKAAKEKGLVPTKQWLAKCQQLYDVSRVNPGVIIAGPPGVGKSTIVQSMVEALSSGAKSPASSGGRQKEQGLGEGNHRLQKVNPLVVDHLSLMFGNLQNKDWIDGIVTSSWRKANRNQCTTWLCFDGALHPGWTDRFNTVLDSGRVLYLDNGDQLYLSDNMNLLFETDDLSSASPATVARSGIVFVDKKVVGWKPVAQAWMETRTQQEQHVLQRAFDKTVNAVSSFIINETKPKVPVSEVGMFQTCIHLLSAMLADNKEIGGKQHIERLYLFCLIWAYGGLLEGNERKAFSEFMKTLSSALPDDDRDICVFDYYVDESGEWDPWSSRVPEAVYSDNQDVLGDIFVETVQTMQTRVLMEFAAASGQNVLLVGPSGAGKTSLINDFIESLDNQKCVNKKLVLSSGSKSSKLQQFIEANIYHRQGFVFGAKENKKLQIFIDDLSMPGMDEYGVQSNNELLRQLVDDRVLCTLQKPFEWRTIEDLKVIGAMTLHQSPTMANRQITQRLLRHFAVFNLPAASEDNMKKIVHGILEANLSQNEGSGLDMDLHSALASVSCRLLAECQNVLRKSQLSGRQHYLFSLKDVVTCFRCLRRLPDESRADESAVISLWSHEMNRIFLDRIARHSDCKWYQQTVQRVTEETWPERSAPLQDHFVTFPVDVVHYQRGGQGHGKVKTALQPIDDLSVMRSSIQLQLDRYNEEFSQSPLDVTLSDPVIGHVVRLHRILSFHHSGHAVLIGSVGTHLVTLCDLVLHIADIPRVPIDSSKPNTFFDGLRSALRLTGSEGKVQAVVLTAYDLHNTDYLDALNSILISGEYPHLFTNDEMDGLLQAVTPALKRERPSLLGDPMKYFVSRVKANLHVMLCLPPDHELIVNAMNRFPGLLSGCQVLWIADWPMQTLLGEAKYFIEYNKMDLEPKELSDSLSSCMADIHSTILTETKRVPWAGDCNDDIRMQAVKSLETKKNKQTTVKVPNLPYSKSIISEHIKQMHRGSGVVAKNEVFVGPMTYRRFMRKFVDLYRRKSVERSEKVEKLEKVISALSQSRTDAKVIRQAIKTISGRYSDAKSKTADLMKQLTSKATLLEKLKAQVGMSTALSAFLQLNDVSDESEEEDDGLLQEDHDEYDKEFDKMRAANLMSRHAKAKEELVTVRQTVEARRKELENARQQVFQWRGKVDRPCIERIKAFSQPPMLIGHVMEMVLALVGKRIPGMPSEKEKEKESMRDDVSGVHSATSSLNRGQKTRSSAKLEAGSRVDRTQWKAYTKVMEDPQKFVNMLHNIQWEDGLLEATMKYVESYLARGTDGTLGVTGEGSLLDVGPDNSQFKPSRRTPSPDNTRGITIAAAKYSNEDSAVLVQYTIAIIEYSRLCGPLKTAIDKQHELEREIEESERLQREADDEPKPEEEVEREPEPEPVDLDADDLPRIQEEVADLQKQFDESVVEKHSLEMELLAMRERLKAATDMVESLKGQESGWARYVEDNNCNEVLLTNCLSAAAFLTYCGGFDTDSRKRLGTYFVQSCDKHGLKGSKTVIFNDMSLTQFIYKETNASFKHASKLARRHRKVNELIHSQMDVKQTEMCGLPCTPLVLEHSCFINQQSGGTAWPLICDSTNYSIEWLKKSLKSRDADNQYMMTVKYKDVKSHLETSLAEGHAIVITDCDLVTLSRDSRFRALIRERRKFLHGKHPFKMMVADHEVECQPKFRMYLHTSDEAQHLPETMAAYVTCLRFQLARADVEELLLDRFLVREKTRLSDEMAVLNAEWLENVTLLAENERQMLDCLSGDVRLMNDLNATKRLAELTKQYDEANESLSRVNAGIESILRAREGFRQIAKRAAVCFDVSQYLREISPLYQFSMDQYLDVYDTAIAHSDRASMKAVIERLTYSAFTTTARSLLDADRFIYTMLLALEIEESQGRVGPGEREYLFSPQYGATVMQALKVTVESRVTQAKKPFDWMQDEQFQNLQTLASYYEWFQEMFDRMPKDGRETQWRAMCESDQSETLPLPDKMDETYSAMQRMLVIRSLRPDRIMQLSSIFIQSTLGKRYTTDVGYDLPALLKQSSSRTPVLLLHTGDADCVMNTFTELATKRVPTNHEIIHMANVNAGKDKTIRRALLKAMEQGHWLLLHNIHNSAYYSQHADHLLSETSQKVDPQFRLWLSADTNSPIPRELMQNSVKVVMDSPRSVKGTLYRYFSSADTELVKQDRTDWAPLLHNICYLHAAVRMRARFGGWLEGDNLQNISFGQLETAVRCCMSELQTGATESAGGRTIPWNALRYQIAEMYYGGCVTNTLDQMCLSAMVDFWLSPASIKRDFELSKIKYKLPVVLFNPNAKQNSYVQALDNTSVHTLDVPEACHLHPSSDTQLGDDQYVFTRLNKVYDCMPASDSLSHSLFERPPTPYDGPPQHCVAGTGSPPLFDRGVVASASHAAMKSRKEVDLLDVCQTLLPRVPKIYTSDSLTERINKMAGNTVFSQFVRGEVELMMKLLTEIKATLQAVKAASDPNVLGDQLSSAHMEAADALSASRIPAHWRHLAGDTAPPAMFSVANWIQELQLRAVHFDKILSLGRDKMPAYWLGAFFNPRTLLALVKQDAYKQHCSQDKSGNLEPLIFHTEITARDKEHLRDPPPEGIFIFGIYLKGAVYDKASSELLDMPAKQGLTQMPVIHLTCVPQHERYHGIEQSKHSEVYACPVYNSRTSTEEGVLDIDLRHEGIQASRWALRGLYATLRPW